jgi:hypothetical protein
MLDASMSYLRQFAPDVLTAVRFAGGPGTGDLLAAVSILTELYATGTRKVPAGAPVGFVPARYAGYLAASAEAGDVTGYRHYRELCVLLALRDGLHSGDVFVPGSRRYADPASFLLTPEAWEPQRVEFLPWRPAAGSRAAFTLRNGPRAAGGRFWKSARNPLAQWSRIVDHCSHAYR